MFKISRRQGWLLLAVACLLAGPTKSVQSQDGQPTSVAPLTASTYSDMVQKLKSGDLSVDFAKLRMSYASTSNYDPEEGSDQIKDMFGKLNAKDYRGALKAANAVLDKQYVNIDAHLVASSAYEGLHDDVAAKMHHDIVVGLVRSILDSGSGTSTATAYKVISVGEEYSVMRVLGWIPNKQSYVHEGARSYDEMEMLDQRSNTPVTRYFDVTLSDEHMEKSLKH
jgi:hypothetical protein